MISRIRIEAFGPEVANVDEDLQAAAQMIGELGMLGQPVAWGEHHIERDMAESTGSRAAYQGRLILHPNVADESQARLGGPTTGA